MYLQVLDEREALLVASSSRSDDAARQWIRGGVVEMFAPRVGIGCESMTGVVITRNASYRAQKPASSSSAGFVT